MSAESSSRLPRGIKLSMPRIAVDDDDARPAPDPADHDVCLTTRPHSSPPWVTVADPARCKSQLLSNAARNPVATSVALRLLCVGERIDFEAMIEVESFAYSSLLGGREFRAWLAAHRRPRAVTLDSEPVRYQRSGDVVTLSLNAPKALNAVSTGMRDALAEMLDTCLCDPTEPKVILRGEGRAFCTGGALEDFGTTIDLAQAHLIRTQQSAAARIHQLGDRIRVELHGAVIGAGLEMAAAARSVAAAPSTWFQLPELSMGLIPGAGGMASLPARIGRHRTAFMLLSGTRIGLAKAVEWGLVDEVVK